MKRYNIKPVNKMEEISDSELKSFKNFDFLLEKYQQKKKKKQQYTIFFASFMVLVVLGVMLYFNMQNSTPNLARPVSAIEHIEQKNELNLKTKSINSKENLDSKFKKNEIKKLITTKNVVKKTSPLPQNNQLYSDAVPKNGFENLFEFFKNEMKYPDNSKKNNISGTVILEFYINNDGNATQISVLKGINDELNNEAIRLLKVMPTWKPAQYNQKKITTRVVLPFEFKIN